MDDSIKTYKCPNCGAALTFDSKTQKLHCSHCDTSIEVEAMEAFDQTASGNNQDTPNWNTNDAGSTWSSSEQKQIHNASEDAEEELLASFCRSQSEKQLPTAAEPAARQLVSASEAAASPDRRRTERRVIFFIESTSCRGKESRRGQALPARKRA